MKSNDSSPSPDNKADKNLRIWLQTLAIGFGIASVGIIIALILHFFIH